MQPEARRRVLEKLRPVVRWVAGHRVRVVLAAPLGAGVGYAGGQVAPRDADQSLDLGVIGFQLVVGERPVDDVGAGERAPGVVSAEVFRAEAEADRAVVHGAAADAAATAEHLAGEEPLALECVVAERDRANALLLLRPPAAGLPAVGVDRNAPANDDASVGGRNRLDDAPVGRRRFRRRHPSRR